MAGIRRMATLASVAARADAPKCGAKTRTGDSCRNPAMPNGRCPRHGGLTPSGAAWHRVVIPADPVKRAKKLRTLEKRRAALAARLADMSPDERRQYERRRKACLPGTPAQRAQKRHDRAAAESFARAAERAPEPSAAVVELDRRIAELSARIADSKRMEDERAV
jgi:hypothetical protein